MAVSALLLGLAATRPRSVASGLAATRPRSVASAHRRAAVRMGLFDALAESMKNDETLGKREGAGLSKEVELKTITWKGPKPDNFGSNSPFRPPRSCRQNKDA